MKKNRLFAAVLVVVLVLAALALTACAGGNTSRSQTGQGGQTPGNEQTPGLDSTEPATEGLSYTYNEETDTYSVSAGSATSEKRIVIPGEYNGKRVTSIAIRAFENCMVENIVIPTGITSIGKEAFASCTGLQTVTFAGDSKLESIGYRAFADCSSLIEITIPANVTSIDERAFSGCSSLIEIAIPANITSIGNNTFEQCADLRLVQFDDKSRLESIGNYAFNGCGIIKITMPDSLTSIGTEAFSKCNSLTEITISKNVTSIDNNAFDGCNNLLKVNWNATNCTKAGSSGSSTIFYGCTSLTTVNIGENVETIPSYAFSECSKLQTVNWNAMNCKTGGFSGCTSLTTVNIGANVKTIPDYAFRYCSELTEITIPASVTSIGKSAFSGCRNMQTVNFKNPNGWKTSYYYHPDISSSDLQNAETAAQYLTSTYCEYNWTREASN